MLFLVQYVRLFFFDFYYKMLCRVFKKSFQTKPTVFSIDFFVTISQNKISYKNNTNFTLNERTDIYNTVKNFVCLKIFFNLAL